MAVRRIYSEAQKQKLLGFVKAGKIKAVDYQKMLDATGKHLKKLPERVKKK